LYIEAELIEKINSINWGSKGDEHVATTIKQQLYVGKNTPRPLQNYQTLRKWGV
jgi:hypothetical protein